MREILVQYLLLAHREQCVIHRSIVAQVDQVPSPIFSGRTEVGVFKQAREGKTRVADIDPVAVRKLVIQRENETMSAICLAPFVLCTVVLGQRGNEAAGEASRQRRDHAIHCPRSLVRYDPPVPVVQRFGSLHTSAKQYLPTKFADAFHQPLVEQLKAAAQVAQAGRAIVKTRPEPWQRDLVMHRAKLSHEELLEYHLVWPFTHPAAQPRCRR